MPAHSRPKDGVLSHAYGAGIHDFCDIQQRRPGCRHKAGHDGKNAAIG
ncbi:MAG TPA: hypothetical protein VIY07_03755 [Pseudolabrys sp.]